MEDAGVSGDPSYFLRVSVVGGGCSGLSYKLDFDNETKPMDQVFEDKGIKIVTDLKSFLYLVNTELEFSDGLNGKGFISTTRMPAAVAVAEKKFRRVSNLRSEKKYKPPVLQEAFLWRNRRNFTSSFGKYCFATFFFGLRWCLGCLWRRGAGVQGPF